MSDRIAVFLLMFLGVPTVISGLVGAGYLIAVAFDMSPALASIIVSLVVAWGGMSWLVARDFR